ncbi:glycylpeptide N-tetradecanoyltransferase [Acrasis kona]|uniref:Glycylpeptide N-tetradecanoyltransferase n=1 Tax=Acrasis kona TaxID=1008807 RepID=A0AAW2ZPD2_9EUKA
MSGLESKPVDANPVPVPESSTQEEDKIKEQLKKLKTVAKLVPKENISLAKIELEKQHKFWDEQPVPKIYEENEESGAIEEKTLDQVRKDPLALPDAFEWYDIDVNSDEDMSNVYTLLEQNYVEDDDAMFRFAYPIPFLRWALTPPGWRRDWHIAVRVKANKSLVAFISGVPVEVRVDQKKIVKMAEINFLCVHKKLREKRLAPKLIAEVTRRVNLTDVWQAVYTAGVLVPKPVSKTRYWHRNLNPPKLIDIGFSSIPRTYAKFRDPLDMTIKYYKLPEKPLTVGFRKMTKKDVPAVQKLLNDYLRRFKVHPEFTQDDFKHWFLTRDDVIHSFVVQDPETKRITDFVSFYSLPSSVIGHQKHKLLKAAYLYFYFANSTPLVQLIDDLLISAKALDFDVLNCLDIMDNAQFIEKCKFGPGDGNLYYYLYNYKIPDLKPEQIGLTML